MKQRANKFIKDRISYYAKMLPEVYTESGNTQEYISGAELMLRNHTKWNGEIIDVDKMYEIDVPIDYRINHESRMISAYNMSGKIGVYNYILKYVDPKHIKSLRYEIFESGNFEYTKPGPDVIFKRNKRTIENEVENLEKDMKKLFRSPESYSPALANEINERASAVIVLTADTKMIEGIDNDKKYSLDPILKKLYSFQRRALKLKSGHI